MICNFCIYDGTCDDQDDNEKVALILKNRRCPGFEDMIEVGHIERPNNDELFAICEGEFRC